MNRNSRKHSKSACTICDIVPMQNVSAFGSASTFKVFRSNARNLVVYDARITTQLGISIPTLNLENVPLSMKYPVKSTTISSLRLSYSPLLLWPHRLLGSFCNNMVKELFSMLLAPVSLLMGPTSSTSGQSFPAGQLVVEPLNKPIIEHSDSAVQLVYGFKDHISLENLAPRSNGHLVLTVSSEPLLYDLDPTKKNQPPSLLHQFSGVSSLTGIDEIGPDVFAVVAGNWSASTLQAVPGTFSVWSVDLSKSKPVVNIISSIPEAAALNGATTLDGSPDLLLIADSSLGAVWRLNLTTGDHSIAIQSPIFSNWSSPVPIGINGIDTFGGSLYFLNSAQGSYGRVPIHPDGSAAGEVEIIARVDVPQTVYDDFDMDWEGNAWIATHPNMMSEVTVEGKERNITGDGGSLEMSQPTAARFGRGSKQAEKTLYVVTGGSQTAGGQIVAVETWLI